MEYDLALKLKKAGFPQGAGCGFMGLHSEQDECAYKPILSELIEACGDWFVGLDRTDNGWGATGARHEGNLVMCKEGTPTGAVAKLWLALQAVPTAHINSK